MSAHSATRLIRLVLTLLILSAASEALAQVALTRSGDRWSLTRAGKPYRIQGAGGNESLALLAVSGGNSTRTWGLDQLADGRLDEAHKHGLSVTVGFWLRHDLDYADEKQVAEQTERIMNGVRKYKDHPAALVWGIGNEMEGSGDNLAVWQHIEMLARLIKKEDPNHPTMTVIAEIGGDKLKNLERHSPSIDIVGVNAYGGAGSLPKRYQEAGGTKPYILAEYGPRGPWDLEKNEIGSFNEELGKVKAATYLESYQAAEADRKSCLGSYAFKWGHKQEATPTWFGMLLADGCKTSAVDVLTQAWSGKPVANQCPQIDRLTLSAEGVVKGNASLKAKLQAKDPEGQPITVEWVLMEDAKSHLTGGYHQETPLSFKENILKTSKTEATFRAPKKPGLYRLFAYVRDGQKAADVANVVFKVEENS